MAGRAPQAVHLSLPQKRILDGFVRAEKSTQQLVRRASLILASAECKYNETAARQVGVSRIVACEWRKRWLEQEERLAAIEKQGDEKALSKAIRDVLADKPGRGAKPRFSAEQACQIVALACESPKESGRPCTHWTQKELADEAIKREIVPTISCRQVGRFLKRSGYQTPSVAVLAQSEHQRLECLPAANH
jgi:putative transposase